MEDNKIGEPVHEFMCFVSNHRCYITESSLFAWAASYMDALKERYVYPSTAKIIYKNEHHRVVHAGKGILIVERFKGYDALNGEKWEVAGDPDRKNFIELALTKLAGVAQDSEHT